MKIEIICMLLGADFQFLFPTMKFKKNIPGNQDQQQKFQRPFNADY